MLKQVKVPEYVNLSTMRSFQYMWKHEGFYGLLKGNGVNVVRIAPFSAFEMFFYDFYKHNIFGGDSASASTKLVCGGLTGMTASTLTYPLDLIRTVLSIKVADGTSGKPGIFECGKDIVARDGVRGLYRGLPATLYVSWAKGNLFRASRRMLALKWRHLIFYVHSSRLTVRLKMCSCGTSASVDSLARSQSH